jgi:hypothetical protein
MKPMTAMYLLMVALCVIFQASLGSDLALLFVTTIVAASAAWSINARHPTPLHLLYLALCFYEAAFALLFKSILAQPLHSNLIDPATTSFTLLVFHIAATAAFLLAKTFVPQINIAKSVSETFDSDRFLVGFAKWGFLLGFILKVAHTALRPQFQYGTLETTAGFGGLGAFGFLVPFALAAQAVIALKTQTTHNRVILIGMLVSVAILSFIGNVKKDIIDATLVLALVAFAYHVRVRPSVIMGGAVLVWFLTSVATPIIHVTRAESQTRTITERIELTFSILERYNYSLDRINAANDLVAQGITITYRPNYSYVFPSTLPLDRFALIFPIDQVVRTGAPGRMTTQQAVQTTLEATLPSALIRKQAAAWGDYVAWAYGFRGYGSIGRPVVGLAAGLWAVGGIGAVFWIGGLLCFCLFAAAAAIAGQQIRSPWAIGVVVFMVLFPENAPDALVGFILRDIPVMVITLALFTLGYMTLSAYTNSASASRPWLRRR